MPALLALRGLECYTMLLTFMVNAAQPLIICFIATVTAGSGCAKARSVSTSFIRAMDLRTCRAPALASEALPCPGSWADLPPNARSSCCQHHPSFALLLLHVGQSSTCQAQVYMRQPVRAQDIGEGLCSQLHQQLDTVTLVKRCGNSIRSPLAAFRIRSDSSMLRSFSSTYLQSETCHQPGQHFCKAAGRQALQVPTRACADHPRIFAEGPLLSIPSL